MPLLDVGHRLGTAAAALEQVAHVPADGRGAVLLEVLLGLVLRVLVELHAHVFVDRGPVALRRVVVAEDAGLEGALVAVERGAPGVLRIAALAPGPVGPAHLQVAEIEGRRLGVGDVGPAGLVDQDATIGTDRHRPSEVHHPSDHVEHVDAHVAHDAIAVLHECPPTAGVDHLVVGAHRRRTGPHLVVEPLRGSRIGRAGQRVAGAHVPVAADLHVGDVAQLAFAQDPVAGLDQVGGAAALSAHLHRPAVLARGGQHGLTLHDVHARGLLHVDVGACLAGFDHGQRVPVVGGADHHHLEVLLGQHLPVIAVGPGLLARLLPLGHQGGRLGQHPSVDITQRNHLHGSDLDQAQQVALAVPPGADQAHAQGLFLGEGRGDEGRGRQSGTRLEELSACHEPVLDPRALQLKPRLNVRPGTASRLGIAPSPNPSPRPTQLMH